MESFSQGVRWWAQLFAVLALVLAPLAWSLVDLLPAAWRLFDALSPEWAAYLWRLGADAVARVVVTWNSIENWKNYVTLVGAILAPLGVFLPGRWGVFFCTAFRYLGWGALGYVLYELSLLEWALFASGWSYLNEAVPALGPFIEARLLWLSQLVGSAGMAGIELAVLFVVIGYGWISLAVVRDVVMQAQEWLQSAFIGEVDPVFPRANAHVASTCAKARRKAINAYLKQQLLPPRSHRQVTFSNGHSPFRVVREYIERRQEVHDVDPLAVAAFLEVPRGSPIKAKDVRLETVEEVTGQYVRLKFESEVGSTPVTPRASIEDDLILLLGRVVDAAILADQHFDSEREDDRWNAMPFFDRIYVEHRPISKPLGCFLGPLLGDALPARVVIETEYPEVFRRALHGGKGKYGQFRNWFGIGIQIEPPNLPQGFISRLVRVIGGETKPAKIERTPWFNAHVPCRRLKSRVVGGVSGKLNVALALPAEEPNQPAQTSESSVHVMSCGPLADGCPSAVTSLSGEPPTVARGGVSNAPAMWLLPPRDSLHESCRRICVRTVPADSATIAIDVTNVGRIQCAASEIPLHYVGPSSVGRVRRRAWVGAFFDRDLRQGHRFPLAACSKGLGDSGLRQDLRGAFVRLLKSDAFGGVFVATQGPEHASNLLLPEPLLNCYLTHLPFAAAVAATLPQTDEPPFIPSPMARRAR